MDELQQDFVEVATLLEVMAIDDIQQYVNFLSSHLRMMSFVLANTRWIAQEPDVLDWFQKSTRQELVSDWPLEYDVTYNFAVQCKYRARLLDK